MTKKPVITKKNNWTKKGNGSNTEYRDQPGYFKKLITG